MFIVFMFSFSVPPLSHLPISLFPRPPVFPFVLFHVFSFTRQPSPVSSSAVTRVSVMRHPSIIVSSPIILILITRHPHPLHPSPVSTSPVTRRPSPRHASPVSPSPVSRHRCHARSRPVPAPGHSDWSSTSVAKPPKPSFSLVDTLEKSSSARHHARIYTF